MHVRSKTQILENTRLGSEIDEYKRRNNFLESDLVVLNDLKNDCKIAKNLESMFRLKYEQQEKKIAVEKQRIKNCVSTRKRLYETVSTRLGLEGLGYRF